MAGLLCSSAPEERAPDGHCSGVQLSWFWWVRIFWHSINHFVTFCDIVLVFDWNWTRNSELFLVEPPTGSLWPSYRQSPVASPRSTMSWALQIPIAGAQAITSHYRSAENSHGSPPEITWFQAPRGPLGIQRIWSPDAGLLRKGGLRNTFSPILMPHAIKSCEGWACRLAWRWWWGVSEGSSMLLRWKVHLNLSSWKEQRFLFGKADRNAHCCWSSYAADACVSGLRTSPTRSFGRIAFWRRFDTLQLTKWFRLLDVVCTVALIFTSLLLE